MGGVVTPPVEAVVAWAAPVAAALATCAGQLWLNRSFARAGERRRRAHERDEAWRGRVEEGLAQQSAKTDVLMAAVASTMRSDIIHKCHRYLDDMGMAGTEEKRALHAQWEDYHGLCEANSIKNHFVDGLVAQVMALPNRPGERGE